MPGGVGPARRSVGCPPAVGARDRAEQGVLVCSASGEAQFSVTAATFRILLSLVRAGFMVGAEDERGSPWGQVPDRPQAPDWRGAQWTTESCARARPAVGITGCALEAVQAGGSCTASSHVRTTWAPPRARPPIRAAVRGVLARPHRTGGPVDIVVRIRSRSARPPGGRTAGAASLAFRPRAVPAETSRSFRGEGSALRGPWGGAAGTGRSRARGPGAGGPCAATGRGRCRCRGRSVPSAPPRPAG